MSATPESTETEPVATVDEAFDAAWDTPLNRRGHFDPTKSTVSFQEHGMIQFTSFLPAPKPFANTTIIATVHEAGRSYWAGRGDRGYAPASRHTWLMRRMPGDKAIWRYVQIASESVKPSDRTEMHELIAGLLQNDLQ